VDSPHLRAAALAALAVVLLTFAVVQFQQRLLRWRAERLMADMHQIRLYQSTRADAQRLMRRELEKGFAQNDNLRGPELR
jgi:hypothetical protein